MTELSSDVVRFRTLGVVDLRRADGEEVQGVLRQPKRLALLAYLTLAVPRGFHRRDVLLAMLWPELDQASARHALRNALYNLRRELGESVVASRGAEEVGIAEETTWCDAVEFERALDMGNAAEAIELYGGDLLRGFFVSGGDAAFEQWLEGERSRLRLRAADAAWAVASAAERAGKAERAVVAARQALTLRPDDEPWLRKVLALLYRLGDQSGALRTYEEYAAHLTSEFETEPAPETRALIRKVRERRPTAPEFVMPRRSSGANEQDAAAAHVESTPVTPTTQAAPAAAWRSRALVIAALLAVCVAAMLILLG